MVSHNAVRRSYMIAVRVVVGPIRDGIVRKRITDQLLVRRQRRKCTRLPLHHTIAAMKVSFTLAGIAKTSEYCAYEKSCIHHLAAELVEAHTAEYKCCATKVTYVPLLANPAIHQ